MRTSIEMRKKAIKKYYFYSLETAFTAYFLQSDRQMQYLQSFPVISTFDSKESCWLAGWHFKAAVNETNNSIVIIWKFQKSTRPAHYTLAGHIYDRVFEIPALVPAFFC